MTRVLAVALTAFLLIGAGPVPEWETALGRDHRLVGTIWDVAAGATITPETLVRRLAARRYALLGEKHDNVDHHRLQTWMLRELLAAGRRPAIVFEMFGADQADAIGRHLAATPRDARGLDVAVEWSKSGWPEWGMYEPIVAVALEAGLPIVAGNLSKPATGALRRGGLGALDAATTARLGLDRALPDEVRARMAAEIRDAHCGHVPDAASLDRFVAVQQSRDASMAAAMREAGGDGAVLIAGAGHVRRDMGVPRLLPENETASVAFIEVRPDVTMPNALPFDYVWFTPRADDRDPCEVFRRPRPSSPPPA